MSSSLAKKYIVEFDKSITKGDSIDAVRLVGLRKGGTFNQNIRKDIRDYYKDKRCVMLGVCGFSENTKIEIDHKDGRKEDWRVSNPSTQLLEDFQPLCKAANDVKRQICKECKLTGQRWDAQNIKGNPYSFYEGDNNFILGTSYSYSNNRQVALNSLQKAYTGNTQAKFDILPRLINKKRNKQSFEAHLQMYIVQNICKHSSLDTALSINPSA